MLNPKVTTRCYYNGVKVLWNTLEVYLLRFETGKKQMLCRIYLNKSSKYKCSSRILSLQDLRINEDYLDVAVVLSPKWLKSDK